MKPYYTNISFVIRFLVVDEHCPKKGETQIDYSRFLNSDINTEIIRITRYD